MIKKNKTAFSLIELSIVLIVVSFMAAMIMVGGSKLKSQARIAAAQALTKSSPVKDIPNLELWLETTLTKSFIKSEIYGGGNISTWYDINAQSNVQNNATQPTGSLQPNYQTNIINGLPAVFFSGTSSVGMLVNNTLNINGNYSAFIVVKTSGALSGRAFQSQNINWLLGTWGQSCICYYANGWVSNSFLQTGNKAYLAESVRNSISKFYINGVDNTTSNVPIDPPINLALGASGLANEPMNGYIGEVIMFSRDLTDLERQDVENYLINKWGIGQIE